MHLFVVMVSLEVIMFCGVTALQHEKFALMAFCLKGFFFNYMANVLYTTHDIVLNIAKYFYCLNVNKP